MSTSKQLYNLSEKDLREVEEFLSMPSNRSDSESDYDDNSEEEDNAAASFSDSARTSSHLTNSSDEYCDSIVRTSTSTQESPIDINEITKENEDIRKLTIFLNIVKENKDECFDSDDASEITKRIETCEENIRKIDKKKDIYRHIEILEKKLQMRELVLSQVSKIIDMENKHSSLHAYMKQKNETMRNMLSEMKQVVQSE